MKYLLTGLGLSLIGAVVSFGIWGLAKAYMISGCVGLILVGVCVIFSGALENGDKMRANYATETFEDRQNRNKFVTRCFLISLPNLLVATALFLIYK